MSAEKKDKPATGASEKPAETTVSKESLSAAGVTSLLKGVFSEEPAKEPEAEPGNEVEPGTEAGGNEQDPTNETEPGAEAEGTEEGETTAESTEPEAGAEGEAAAGEENEPIEGLEAEVQERIDKRIGKIVKQRETEKELRVAAESRVAQLEAEVAQARQQGARPAATGLETLDDAQLETMGNNASRFLEEAGNFLDGAASEAEETRIKTFMEANGMDEAGLKRRVRETEKLVNQVIPARKQQRVAFKATEAQVEPTVKKYFPFLDKKDSPEYQIAQEVVTMFPELSQRTPAHRVALGAYVLGMQELERRIKADEATAKAAKEGKATKPVKPPVKAAAGKVAAPTVRTGKKSEEDGAREQFNAKPTRESMANLVKIGLRDN